MSGFDWTSIAGPLIKVGSSALGTIIGGPAGTLVGGTVGPLIAAALGCEETPEAVASAIEAAPPGTIQKIEANNAAAIQDAITKSDEERIRIVNETMRMELVNGDRFQKYWRPAAGYVISIATLLYVLLVFAAGVHFIATGKSDMLMLLLTNAERVALALMPCGAAAGIAAWGRTKEKMASQSDLGEVIGQIAKAGLGKIRK